MKGFVCFIEVGALILRVKWTRELEDLKMLIILVRAKQNIGVINAHTYLTRILDGKQFEEILSFLKAGCLMDLA